MSTASAYDYAFMSRALKRTLTGVLATSALVLGALAPAQASTPLPGEISGTVHGIGPRADTVQIYGPDGDLVALGDVASDGSYSVTGLQPDTEFRVSFARVSGFSRYAAQYYADASEGGGLAGATPVRLSGTQVASGIDATLSRGVKIVGILHDQRHEEVRCGLEAFSPTGSLVSRRGFSDARGRIHVPGLAAGTYVLRTTTRVAGGGDCTHGTQYLSEMGVLTPRRADAALIDTRHAGRRLDVNYQHYQDDNTISGTVAFPGGSFSGERVVSLLGRFGRVIQTASVPEHSSAFAFTDVENGTYKVAFDRVSGFAIGAPEFYNDVPEAQGVRAATPVVVGGGTVQDLGHVVVDAGGTISGQLAALPSGGSMMRRGGTDCIAQAFTDGSSLVTRTSDVQPDGSFDLTGLSTGDYGVRVTCGSTTKYLVAGSNTLSDSAAGLKPVSVTRGTSTVVPGRLAFPTTTGGGGGGASAAPAAQNVVKPAISGTPLVGMTLTADPGTWSPTGATFSYRWLAGGVEVEGATARTFVPTASQVGKALTVEVTAVASGVAPGSATSDPSPAVGKGRLENAGRPLISGAPHVNGVLRATGGSWVPGDIEVAYQWMADGEALAGATSPTFTVPQGLLGRSVSVEVTASRDGYEPATASSEPVEIGAGSELVNVTTPVVGGLARVGKVLVAGRGTWSRSGLDFSYAWTRSGKPIRGARKAFYELRAADLGHRLRVIVTATAADVAPVVARSRATDRVARGILTVQERPEVRGSNTLGGRVRITAGEVSVEPSAVKVQWFRGSKAIRGATGRVYEPRPQDVGHVLLARVTYSAPGYEKAVRVVRAGTTQG